MTIRPIRQVIQATRTLEGGGFPVTRPFPTPQLSDIDPFLLLDHMGPVDWAPNEAIGAPDHPHRGFETVSYILAGTMEHRDSHGNVAALGPGDVQWMTAGAGVIHSELPSPAFKASGGRMEGFQIWVNLPRSHKMMGPRYQTIRADEIPCVEHQGAITRVIAGTAQGISAQLDTVIPILMWHIQLQPGSKWSQHTDGRHQVMAYVFGGACHVGEPAQPVDMGHLITFETVPGKVSFGVPENATEDANVLVLGGQPTHEPIARYGPFVMNTRAEIMDAIQDFRSGRFGTIPPQDGPKP